jgi:hypothetical protein
MALFGRFSKKVDPAEAAARERIRSWVEAALGSEPPLTLTISEIDCADPTCPGLETIILVMRAGEATQAVKLRKPMIEASEQDVREAVKFL